MHSRKKMGEQERTKEKGDEAALGNDAQQMHSRQLFT
jgi:hypothetical protein